MLHIFIYNLMGQRGSGGSLGTYLLIIYQLNINSKMEKEVRKLTPMLVNH